MLAGPATGCLNLAAGAVGLPHLIDVYSFTGMIFVLGLYYAPYPFPMMHSALSLMNPNLEDAASLHGRLVRGNALALTRFQRYVLGDEYLRRYATGTRVFDSLGAELDGLARGESPQAPSSSAASTSLPTRTPP